VSEPVAAVSEETARRIAEALEQLVAMQKMALPLLERVAHPGEPVSFPNAPALPKRGAGRGR
jgi:hypothetical protein